MFGTVTTGGFGNVEWKVVTIANEFKDVGQGIHGGLKRKGWCLVEQLNTPKKCTKEVGVFCFLLWMKEVLGWQSKEKEKNVRRRCSSWVFSSVAVCSAVV
jgi:hypothetical protein